MSHGRQRTAKRVTIKDVAQAAGVSVTTVSNVLNDRTEAMTETTLHRIQETIHVLGYRPSNVARSLVTRQTATIGVIVAEIDTPLFLQALNVIEPIARNANHNILLCTTASNLSDERQVVDLLLEKRVDGIIFLSTSVYLDQNYPVSLPSDAPPMVIINRTMPYEARFDQISFDNTNGIIRAVEHLVQLGHRHIAHLLGPRGRNSSEERLRGYRLGLEQHGLEYCEACVRLADYEQPQATWEQATLELLKLSPRPTAIIGANDIVAATAMRTVQRAGLRVPQDISIIGVDNQPFCTYLNPALTTIQLPILEAGKRAIEILLARIAGTRTMTEHLILPCLLAVRESTGLVVGAKSG
jgi:DNA-binding LacI/PurR family transcriptional regulator